MVILVVVAVLVIVPLWLMVRETRSRHGDTEYERGLELPPAAVSPPDAASGLQGGQTAPGRSVTDDAERSGESKRTTRG